jgi:thioredoxin-like negative regulator of GroEL
VLAQLVALDPDDLTMRKKLAQLSVAERDWPAAERWTLEAIRTYVPDPQLHRWRAQALEGLERAAPAAAEYGVAAELAPAELDLRLSQARQLVRAGQRDQARDVLAELLKRDGKYPGAQELLESLE